VNAYGTLCTVTPAAIAAAWLRSVHRKSHLAMVRLACTFTYFPGLPDLYL
jgi:hypothetical protein